VPDPDRSGPATAIVVDDSAYVVDFEPGVVRRANAAVLERHITALEPANLRVAFLTHLHSDHHSCNRQVRAKADMALNNRFFSDII
jgi:ribonuclease Z